MIRADDRVSTVLKNDEALVEVFVSVSKAFEMLRKPAMRRTMARMVTISQAAQIAGIDVSILLEKLNATRAGSGADERASLEFTPAATEEVVPAGSPPPSEPGVPDGLLATPPAFLVDVDVRDDLRAGREPLRKILDGARSLGAGQILRVWAIFEPTPLYAVLGKQGFAHYTERFAADDWRVWFFRDARAHEAQTASTAGDLEVARLESKDGDVVILDVRGLEPPEPLVQTLEALAVLPRGKTLVQLNQRVPQFLLPKLEERGFMYEIREQSESLVRIFIQHKPD